MGGPYENLKVVEIAAWVAGPGAGGILADWGARVVKIEPQSGDPMRAWSGGIFAAFGIDPWFDVDNRGKRSVALDMGQPAGKDVVLQLLEDADVLVTNFRPAVLGRLGLDHASLAKRFPRLIYAAITGYGLEGPDRDRAAYDAGAYWSRAGIAWLLTADGTPPPFPRAGMGDHSTAVAAVSAIGAALWSRERTGRGQLVTTSLMRQGIYTIACDVNLTLRTGVAMSYSDRAVMGPTVNSYRAGDGLWFWLIGLEVQRHWAKLARVVDRPAWETDPRYADPVERASRHVELVAELDGVFTTRTRAEWGEIFDAHDLWWAPVQSVEEIVADPQAWAAGAYREVPDGNGGADLGVATPADFAGTPWAPAGPVPTVGQHTEEVLTELGYDAEGVAVLRKDGVIP